MLKTDDFLGWESLLTDEERALRDEVRAFVQKSVLPRINDDFHAGTFARDLVPQMARLGLLGANLTGYDCKGVGALAYGLICQELEAGDSGLRSFVSVHTSLAMYAIHTFGDEVQKKRWLPPMASGRVLGSFGLTEPNHGSDPASMELRATKDGDGWVLNGSKAWVTNLPDADLCVVWAKTGEGPESICGFVINPKSEGAKVTVVTDKLSLRASSTGTLTLEGHYVKEEQRLAHAKGLIAPLKCLNHARFGVALGVLGAARFCVELAVQYARERTQFGVPIGSKQLIQGRLADMIEQLTVASATSLHFARLKEAGSLHFAQVSLLKRNNCRVALEIARSARALLGANGVLGANHVMRHAANLESPYTYEGSHEIHSLILGAALTDLKAF